MTNPNPTTSSPQLNSDSQKTSKMLPAASWNLPSENRIPSKFGKISLKAKVIFAAIALSVIPVTLIGVIAYRVTASHIGQQIDQNQQHRSQHFAQMLEKFISDRANEAETLADSPIFTNPNVMATVTLSQKQSALDKFQERTGFYDSIVYLDLAGNPLFQSQAEDSLRENYSDRRYFQQAIERKQTTLKELDISSLTEKSNLEFAVPVTHAWTGEVIGVLRFRIPQERIVPLLADYVNTNEQWHLINTQGTVFASSLPNLINQSLANYFPSLQTAHVSRQVITELVNNPSNSAQEQIINYVPVKLGAVNPNLNLGVALALDRDLAFAPLKPLRWIYLGGTIGTVLLIGSIAGFLANRIVQPLLKLAASVDELSRGKLNTRIKLDTQDELALLGERINLMAEQLEVAMQRQKTITRTSELLSRIAQARSSRELQLPFSLFLTEVRKILGVERAIFYEFDPQWWGTVIAESVVPSFPRTLGVQFEDPCFTQKYVKRYQRGKIQAISDIYRANLTQCYLQQLEPYKIKASLVVPVILSDSALAESDKLIGLLIVHQCSRTRIWEQADIDYLQQIAYQLAIVLSRYATQNQEQSQKTATQRDLTQILQGMKDVARGDLRAKVSQNNSQSELNQAFQEILHHLRQTVEQLQLPAQEINYQLGINQRDVADLKVKLKEQASQLTLIFAFIEQMSNLITEMSVQANTASQTVDGVVADLEIEKINFNHAIAFMSHLENSLRHNTQNLKNLGNAADNMTKVIGSIRKINLRASLLASKLSKRIPEFDDSAFGLKEEIRSIQQSIAATKELENVVRDIDREIAEVLRKFYKSEERLQQENYLVTNASHNLEQIVKTTQNAQQHLLSLVNMTKIQLQTSQKIDHLKEELNETSASIITMSDRTLTSLEETTVTARDFANVVEFFKLESKN